MYRKTTTLNKLNEFTARKCLMTQPYMPAGNHVITYDHGGGDRDKQNICIGQSGTKALESKKNMKRKEDEKNTAWCWQRSIDR